MEPRCSVLALATSFLNDLEGFSKSLDADRHRILCQPDICWNNYTMGGTWCSSVFIFWTEKHSGTLLPSQHDSVLALLLPVQQIQASLLFIGLRLELHMHKQTGVWRGTLKQGEEMAISFLKFKHFGLYFAPQFICVRQRLVSFSILRGVKNLT